MNEMNEFMELEQILEEFGIGMEILALILGIGMVFMLIYGIFAIISYVFQSLGLYSIATRRGIKNPWLAWIPGGSQWIAGTISDQYRYITKGQVKNNRVIMVVLAIAAAVLSMIVQGISTSSADALLEMFLSGEMGELPGEAGATVGIGAGVSSLLSLLESAASLALFVFWQISLYDLYMSCNPKNAVLFLVLGILFSFTVPFFIFACRKKEEGMPPRKMAPAVEIPAEQPAWQPAQPQNTEWQPVAPVQEPWEQDHE